jgi:drug/metabolite transporter (DMT)-like permease
VKSAPTPTESHPLGLAVLIGAQLAIGSAALLARAGLAAGLSPAVLAAWRLLIAAGIVWLLRGSQASRAVPSRIRLQLVVAGLLLSVHFVAWFASLQYLSVARSTLIVTTAPVWAGLGGALFRRERQSSSFWFGLAIASIGVWLVVDSGPGSATHVEPFGHALLGDFLAILGAVAIAAYLLITQPYQTTLGTSTVVSWTYAAAAACTWLWIPLASPVQLIPANGAGWLSVIGMAVLPQLVGHTSLNWSLRHFPAGIVSAATLLEPVFAGALAWLLLHEPLSPRQLGGGAVLLLGVGLALCRPAGSQSTQNAERPA